MTIRICSKIPVRVLCYVMKTSVIAVHLNTKSVPLLTTLLRVNTMLLRTTYSGS